MEFKNALIYKDISLTSLADKLKEKIKSKDNFFASTNIIFPNDKLSQWFKSYWLKTELAVLMNVKFNTLEAGLLELIDISKEYKLANRNELRTYIIKQLAQTEKKLLDNNIVNYIYNGETLDSIRLFDLANTLSKLFLDYEKQNIEIKGWQKLIYDNVLKELDERNISTFNYIHKHKKGFIKTEEIIFFGFNNFNNLYFEIVSELSVTTKVIIYEITNELNCNIHPKVMNAPSRIREVELIHSEICKLTQKDDVFYSDILVLCPNLNKYEIEISKVFNQDNINFPSIPYSINDSNRQKTDVTVGLKKLFEIATKGFYTRLDFTDIINNKIIQTCRGITSEDVENWKNSIIEMNVYRNGKNIDDWEYAKKRVILSKVASINDIDNNIVELTSGKYIPFSNIDFNDESIIKFVSIIDYLNNWIKEFKTNDFIKIDKVKNLYNQLSKWFSLINIEGVETNYIFRKFTDELNYWLNFDLNDLNIPLNTLFYTLFDLSEENKLNVSRLFIDGVSFVDYEENIIMHSKYLFILGLGSNEFPKKKNFSEIDLRSEVEDNGMNSFISQCNNADTLYLSYVNHNLKTDEDFYPSTYIFNIFEKLNIDLKYYKSIGIDETRSWNDLFTKKEYKEKDYYYGLFSSTETDNDNFLAPIPEMINKVSVSQMKKFLTEPLKYKAEHLFGVEDDTVDSLNEEFEPFELKTIDRYILIKSVILYLLKNPNCKLIDENTGELDFELARKIFERFIIEHKIPNINEEIEENSIEEVSLSGISIINNILQITNGNFELIKLEDVKLNINDEEIILMCSDEFCLSIEGNTRKYIEINFAMKENDSTFLNMYICSLMDIATINDDEEYHVELYKGVFKTSFRVNSTIAYEKLIDIYKEMNNYELNAYMPLDLVKRNDSFEKIIEDATGQNGKWRFFKGKKIFSPYNDLGYNKYNYSEKSTEMKNLLKRLVIYINSEEESNE